MADGNNTKLSMLRWIFKTKEPDLSLYGEGEVSIYNRDMASYNKSLLARWAIIIAAGALTLWGLWPRKNAEDKTQDPIPTPAAETALGFPSNSHYARSFGDAEKSIQDSRANKQAAPAKNVTPQSEKADPLLLEKPTREEINARLMNINVGVTKNPNLNAFVLSVKEYLKSPESDTSRARQALDWWGTHQHMDHRNFGNSFNSEFTEFPPIKFEIGFPGPKR